MAIYFIADLHLSFTNHKIEKPMDIFGENWENFEERLKQNWIDAVSENDLVVIPGDFSWATYLDEAIEDFKFLDALPGKKLISKGNHDYWWETLAHMQRFVKENDINSVEFLMNNSYEFENKIIVGTRGWLLNDKEDGERMIAREVNRLELSIQDALKKENAELKGQTDNKAHTDKTEQTASQKQDKEIIAVLHYPPVNKEMVSRNEAGPFIETLKKYGIQKCFYGHLHGESHNDAIEGDYQGVQLKLVSADYLNFKPYLLSIF